MISLKMTREEANVLKGTLTEALDEIRTEIVRTESWELKETLKTHERALEHLSAQLAKAGAVRATAHA